MDPTLEELRRFLADPDAFLNEVGMFLVAQGDHLSQTIHDAHDMTSLLNWMGQDKDASMERLMLAVTGADAKQEQAISGNELLRDKISTMCSSAGDVVHLVDEPDNKKLFMVADVDPAWNVVPRDLTGNPEVDAPRWAAAKELQGMLLSGVARFVKDVADAGAAFTAKGAELSQVNLPGVKPSVDATKFLEKLGLREAEAAAGAAPAFLAGPEAGIPLEAFSLAVTALGVEADTLMNGTG
jgi:hypothetical protein